MEIVNRKAKYNYEFIDTYIAGIVLEGLEVKAIRNGNMDISEAYCYFVNNELFLKNSLVSYKSNSDIVCRTANSIIRKDSTRDRKLLLNKNELLKIKKSIETKGMTVIPYKVFINNRGVCKIEIAIAKGKKTYDKRETLKQRSIDKEMSRIK
ncbi:SsrA-binding protein [uncultured Methanobrevibacter sp.]|uniref:SsrA-binding protein n=1 Tax=uncultured Methanobrevibacter sp. TaxID=253161 RepID=UPI0025E63D0F|nr:SsrA-binding protein [uncultured Methanobrevibacter sp.]